MFSNISGNLSGVTSWLSESSKQAANAVQKSVTEIGQGVTEMMKEEPNQTEKTENVEEDQPIKGDHETVDTEQPAVNRNEVLTQVSAKFVSDVSSVWGSALSMGKTAMAKVEQNEYVKQATTVVTETATSGFKLIENAPLVKDFNLEQEKFINENKKGGDVRVPWVGYKEEEQLRDQILQLSKDKRNFLRAPPAGAQFEFEYKVCQPIALAILEHDNNLVEMRFQLVPKVTKEVDFWKNYFYRISLIKQSAEPIEEAIKEDESSESPSITEEFASEELGTKNADGTDADVPHWEKELHDELQEYEVVEGDDGNGEWEKELEDMLGESPDQPKEEKSSKE